MLEQQVPHHVAIIMDGNGRWAKARGKSRTYGHEVGAKTFLDIVESADQLGIKVLSIFSFSTENFKRPKVEVEFIMDLIVSILTKQLNKIIANNVKVLFSGRRKGLPVKVLQMMDQTAMASQNNTGLILNICLNYGGHNEIVDMVKQTLDNHVASNMIDEDYIKQHLYQNLPPVDLMIRTSGEKRISNFMLWQNAYAEFYFTDTLWPDFNQSELIKAINEYQTRDRRFGGLK